MSGLTRDAFLGGRLQVWQPATGYRAGIDPVLLAAAVPARPGQRVLDLGCGVGVVLMCLAARVGELGLWGVEIQPAYCDLARRNLAENGIEARVACADLAALPAEIAAIGFDHVVANPPYLHPGSRTPSVDPGRDVALAGPTPLKVWVDVAARRLRPGGQAHFIQRADRLPELLGAVSARFGSVRLCPVAPRQGRPAKLVLIRAVKGGRGAFRMLAPLTLHAGDRHIRDGDDYTPAVGGILRAGDGLDLST